MLCGTMIRILYGRAANDQRVNISFRKKMKMLCGRKNCFKTGVCSKQVDFYCIGIDIQIDKRKIPRSETGVN